MVKPTRRFPRFDATRIGAAIAAAEAKSSGQIVVSIAPPFWGDVEAAARRAFVRLRVAHTRHRNGVLIFVVPSRRTFVLLGDDGIHTRVGDVFWRSVAVLLESYFHRGAWDDGIVAAIGAIGDELAHHFPRGADDVNELPDEPELPPA